MRSATVFPPRHLDHPDFAAASSRFILRIVVLGGGGGATEPASRCVWMYELSAQGGLFGCNVKPRGGPTTRCFGRAGAHWREKGDKLGVSSERDSLQGAVGRACP